MSKTLLPEYESLIFQFRGMKAMVDSDLALLYGVPTKALKQQVKRNIERFTEDFMFILSKVEKKELVTNCDRLSNLKKEINKLDEKLNQAFKFLLEKIDALHQKEINH